MKHLAGEPRQSTCLTTDECRGWPDSRPQKVNASCPMGTGGPFPGGKVRPGHDADQSPLSSAEIVNE
jgi:hypothetical protein